MKKIEEKIFNNHFYLIITILILFFITKFLPAGYEINNSKIIFTILIGLSSILLPKIMLLFLILISLIYQFHTPLFVYKKRFFVMLLQDYIFIGVFIRFIFNIIKEKIPVKKILFNNLNKVNIAFIFFLSSAVISSTINCFYDIGYGTQITRPFISFMYIVKLCEYFLTFILFSNFFTSSDDIKLTLKNIVIIGFIVSIIGIILILFKNRFPFFVIDFEYPEINTNGGIFLFIFSLLFSILLYSKSKTSKLIYIIGSLLAMFCIFYTYARGSYVAFIFSLIIFFILSFTYKQKIIISLLILFVFSYVYLIPGSNIKNWRDIKKNRIGKTFSRMDTQTESRLTKINNVMNYVFEYDIVYTYFGLGVTGAGFIDSSIVRTLGEQGIIGILCALYLCSVLIHSLYKKLLLSELFYKKFLFAGIIIILVLLVHSLTSNTFFISKIMFPFMALLGLLLNLQKENYDRRLS